MRRFPLAVLVAALCAGSSAVRGAETAAQPPAAERAARPRTVSSAPSLADYEIGRLKLGGDFTLTNQDGRRTNLKEFRSKVVVLFFGYTYCPDVCPVTMSQMDRVRDGLGAQAGALQTLFVSIDPERDTPARLKAYLGNFGGHTIALTGTPAEVQRAAGAYRVRYEKEERTAPAQYLMGHTAYLYMVDGHGKLRYVFPPDVEDRLLAEGVRMLLSEGRSSP
jgi:protein SCO1/2